MKTTEGGGENENEGNNGIMALSTLYDSCKDAKRYGSRCNANFKTGTPTYRQIKRGKTFQIYFKL